MRSKRFTGRRTTHPIEALESRRLLSRTIFVDASAPAGGTHDGSSWAAAYTNLATAISVAAAGDELHVADGTYKPTTAGRTISFQLKNGVKLYGAYAGYGAADPDARNVAQFVSTLSGDIGFVGGTADNSYHVVTASGVTSTAVLDGFTVTGGNANGATNTTNLGGGIYALGGSPTVNQCTFTGNNCTTTGGAMYFDTASAPTIIGCAFSGNSATGDLPAGGAVSLSGGTISGCSFTNNSIISTRGRGGGAIHIAGTVAISDCTFSGNSAILGGAVWSQFGMPTFNNCTFTGNQASLAGGAADGSGAFVNCAFTRNSVTAANGDGGAIEALSSLSSPVRLTACMFTRNMATRYGGAVYAPAAVVTDCVFVANAANQGGGALVSVGVGSRVVNSTFAANSAPLGSAVQTDGTPILNSILWNGQASLSSVIFGSATLSNSDVQGGYAGTGNIDADPRFVRNPSAGADNTWGTADDDYGDLRLQFNSPCVDTGNNASVPAGVTTDVAGQPRFFDFPGANDPGAIVDMGAYELGTTLGVLRVADGQSLALPAGRNTFVVEQLSIGVGATLDVGDNALVLRGASVASVQALIQSGSHGGDWLGQGLTSSAAASDPNGVTALGFASNASLNKTSFAGVSGLTSTDVLVKYTYSGDANLDGQVDIGDLGLLAGAWQQLSGKTWFDGDFTYDGAVNIGDLGLLAGNWQKGVGNPL